MTPSLARRLCGGLLALSLLAWGWHGPVPQLPDYHHFVDQRGGLGMPNVANVVSNLGFLLAGLWGLAKPAIRRGRGAAGYTLFCIALALTAFGSSWYHLAPDDSRLVWDRLPIALACAGLLSAVWDQTVGLARSTVATLGMAALAAATVAWWRWGDLHGEGDLAPYLILQAAPLIALPLLQAAWRRPMRERLAVAAAITCYVAAKALELGDQAVFEALGWVSGHTLKHVLASLAAFILVGARAQDSEEAACSR